MKQRLMKTIKEGGLVFYSPCDSTIIKDLVTGVVLSSIASFKVVSNDNPFGGSCLTMSSYGDGFYYYTPSFNMEDGDYTVCGWFKSTTDGNGGLRAMSGAAISSYCGYGFNASFSRGKSCWLLNSFSWGEIISSPSFINGKWNHYELSKNGNTYMLFVNGIKIDEKSYSASAPGNQFHIQGQYGQYFCHISIYNKVLHTSNFSVPTKPY